MDNPIEVPIRDWAISIERDLSSRNRPRDCPAFNELDCPAGHSGTVDGIIGRGGKVSIGRVRYLGRVPGPENR